IELCTNNIPNQTIYNETLKHELIHAYDYCNRQFDPQDPRMMACSEIRAAKLSGDCSRWNELLRGNFKYNLETCVKRRAALSLQMRGVDTKYVDLAMDCYADHDPFHS
ncbi:mitochondrial inner membrane protease ATP23, partial [Gorgonomyces haynaldii]